MTDVALTAPVSSRPSTAVRAGRYPIPARESVMSLSRRAGAQQLAALLDDVVAERARRSAS